MLIDTFVCSAEEQIKVGYGAILMYIIINIIFISVVVDIMSYNDCIFVYYSKEHNRD